MKKRHFYLISIVFYLAVAAVYFAGKVALKEQGLEYRFWADTLARVILWCVPFVLLGVLIWHIRGYLLARGKSAAGGVLLGIFILFIIGGTLASAWEAFVFVFRMERETRMPDGNLVVSKPSEYDGLRSESYYAEPVRGVARRRFFWDEERYADSLSRIYDTRFQAVLDEELGTVYLSEDYPDIQVQVWKAGYSPDDYLDENLCYLVTSEELEKKGAAFFEGAAELTDYTVDKSASAVVDAPQAYQVTALTICEDQAEEASQKIALFIQEELLNARRADGENLWKNLDGSIFVSLKMSEKDTESYSFNIPFGRDPEYDWVYDENVEPEAILERLEQEFSYYRQQRKYSGVSTERENEDGTEVKDVPEVDTQSIYNQINDGFVAIYVSALAGDPDTRFLTDQDAKGNMETIVYEDESTVRFLRYDRESKNENCLLYVYYEADKYEDGSYSPSEARILDMYAYVPETGEVIVSGKKTWSDVGSAEYREATGE